MGSYNFAKTWRNIPLGARIIRLFLGVTFIYGGWNKATDPGFLNPKSPSYIGAQLSGYLDTSPLAFVLERMVEHATILGWSIMITEFAIGIATLAGIALQLAAFGGFTISITLWLTATWTVKPYFLGSDTAYAILWLTLFLLVRQNTKGARSVPLIPDLRDRREIFRLFGVAAGAVGATFLGGKFPNKNPTPEAGTTIAKVTEFPIGSSKFFTAFDGRSAVLFRTNAGVFAYARACTHQGCNVNYNEQQKLLICPCHGAQFDPNKGGAAISGPAKLSLPKVNVAVTGPNIVEI